VPRRYRIYSPHRTYWPYHAISFYNEKNEDLVPFMINVLLKPGQPAFPEFPPNHNPSILPETGEPVPNFAESSKPEFEEDPTDNENDLTDGKDDEMTRLSPSIFTASYVLAVSATRTTLHPSTTRRTTTSLLPQYHSISECIPRNVRTVSATMISLLLSNSTTVSTAARHTLCSRLLSAPGMLCANLTASNPLDDSLQHLLGQPHHLLRSS
jgi:hypothetical protein